MTIASSFDDAWSVTGVWYLPRCDVTITLFVNRGFVGQRALLDAVVDAAAAGAERSRCLDGVR